MATQPPASNAPEPASGQAKLNPNSGKTSAAPPATVVHLTPNTSGLIYTLQSPWYDRAASESWRVISNTAKDLWDDAKTAAAATGIGVSPEAASAARASIAQGAANTVESLGTLIGPSAEDTQAAAMLAATTGDNSALDIVQAGESARQTAWENVGQSVKKAWNDAEARSGTAGASAMVLTELGTQIVGQKGLGLASDAAKLAKLGTAAEIGEDAAKAAGKGKDGAFILRKLRTLKELDGKSEGGPGKWGKSPKRTGGEAYQEQISGVERGTEYNVNGTWFDGWDSNRGVLQDAKDWSGYPPLDQSFWQPGVVDEANRQLQAIAATAPGTPIEWVFSTQSGADAVAQVLGSNRISGITTVVIPKY